MMPPDAWADLKERISAQLRERSNVVRGSAYLTHVPELVAEIEALRAAACAPPSRSPSGALFGVDGQAVGRDLEFTCPVCGGHTWGTADATNADPAAWLGECHGNVSVANGAHFAPCTFTWTRRDDAKHFAPRGPL